MLVRCIAGTAAAILVAASLQAHEGGESQFNFRDDVRPIFLEHCGGCHHAGGVGPMSLLEYAEAVPWANAIKLQVLERTMPPWLPEDGVSALRHARTLSAKEIDVIVDWTAGLTPEGEPLSADELARADETAWSMGEPDLVLTPSEGIVIGEDDYEFTACEVMSLATTESVIAQAFEVRPERKAVLRRATVSLGDSCDGRPLATWLPGQGEVALPGAHGQRLPAGASVAVEYYYVKGWDDEGKRIVDRSELGIRLAEAGATVTSAIEVPDAGHAFDEPVDILALYPTPRDAEKLSGEPWVVELVRPDGRVDPILVLERFDPAWREKYVLTEPVHAPAGSRLRMTDPSLWIDVVATDGSAGP